MSRCLNMVFFCINLMWSGKRILKKSQPLPWFRDGRPWHRWRLAKPPGDLGYGGYGSSILFSPSKAEPSSSCVQLCHKKKTSDVVFGPLQLFFCWKKKKETDLLSSLAAARAWTVFGFTQFFGTLVLWITGGSSFEILWPYLHNWNHTEMNIMVSIHPLSSNPTKNNQKRLTNWEWDSRLQVLARPKEFRRQSDGWKFRGVRQHG